MTPLGTRYWNRLLSSAPGMNIALVTFVQAVTLERLVDEVVVLAAASGVATPLPSLLVAMSLFVGVVLTWLVYSQLFCLLEWVPHPTQAFIPFLVGLAQLSAISLLGSGALVAALLVVVVLVTGSALAMAHAFGYFGATAENHAVIESFPARRAVVGLLGATGALLATGAAAAQLGAPQALWLLGLGVSVHTATAALWLAAWWRMLRRKPENTAAYQRRLVDDSPGMNIAAITFVQAITLEKLVERVVGLSGSGPMGAELIPCYLLAASVFVGVIVAWLVYSQMFCVLDWVPDPSQPLVPFVLGVAQFSTLALLAPETLSIALAIYGLATLGAGAGIAHSFRVFSGDTRNEMSIAVFPRRRVVAVSFLLGGLVLLAVPFAGSPPATALLAVAVVTHLGLVAVWSRGWWRLVRLSAQAR